MRKLMTLLLSLVLVLSGCSLNVLSTDSTLYRNLYPYTEFTASDDGTSAVATLFSSGTYVESIPENVEIDGNILSVETLVIGDGNTVFPTELMKNSPFIKEVVIPSTIQSLEGAALPAETESISIDSSLIETLSSALESTAKLRYISITGKAEDLSSLAVFENLDTIELDASSSRIWPAMPELTREGYLFRGWYTEKGGVKIQTGMAIDEEDNVAIAEWSVVPDSTTHGSFIISISYSFSTNSHVSIELAENSGLYAATIINNDSELAIGSVEWILDGQVVDNTQIELDNTSGHQLCAYIYDTNEDLKVYSEVIINWEK